jgi:hypothetical protein
MQSSSLKYFECPTIFNFLLHQFMDHIYRNLSYSYSFVCLLFLWVLQSMTHLGLIMSAHHWNIKLKIAYICKLFEIICRFVKMNCSCTPGWKIYVINEEQWKDVTSLYSIICYIGLRRQLIVTPSTQTSPGSTVHLWSLRGPSESPVLTVSARSILLRVF